MYMMNPYSLTSRNKIQRIKRFLFFRLFIMTKGSIGLNAGAIWNLLSDGQHWSFEALRAKSALTDADLWSAIGWLARENKIEIDNTSSHPIFCPGTNFYF